MKSSELIPGKLVRCMIVALSFLTASPTASFSQSLPSSVLPLVSVETMLQQSADAIERLISVAFDRLDLALLTAGMEARATINSTRVQFRGSMTKSITELDGQQRRVIADLQELVSAIDANIDQVAGEFRTGTNRALSDIRLLVSNNPGALFVEARPILYGDTHADIEVFGTALSNARLENFAIAGLPINPVVIHRDDERIVYRVNIKALSDLGVLGETNNKPEELPVVFNIDKESWWPWSSSIRGPFAATILMLPTKMGEARAVFSTVLPGVERRSQQRGPFVSPRVKSRVMISGFPPFPKIVTGKRTDIWSALPSEGWRIDLSTIDYMFKDLFDNCWSARSGASWASQTEQILRVRAFTIAEGMPGKTCKTSTTISFEEWRPTQEVGTSYTEWKPIFADDMAVFRLQMAHDKARLSHVEVRSPMFQRGTKMFRIGSGLPRNISGEYDTASQSVFLTTSYLK